MPRSAALPARGARPRGGSAGPRPCDRGSRSCSPFAHGGGPTVADRRSRRRGRVPRAARRCPVRSRPASSATLAARRRSSTGSGRPRLGALVRRQASLELERDRVVLGSGGVRVHPFGRLGRGDRRAEGLPRPIGAEPMMGDLGGADGRIRSASGPRLRQHARKPFVERAALGGQQLRLDDLAEQRVPQAKRPGGRIRDQDAGRDRRPERLADLGLRALGDRRDQLLVDRATGDRHDAEQALRRVRDGWRSGRPASRPAFAATARSRRAARPPRVPRRRTGCRRSGHGCGRPAHRRPCRP